ncbi:MAG: VOC family protein [Planctomycetota bacterium]
MIDHVVLQVADLEKSRAFYNKALAPLGYRQLADFPDGAGYGATRPVFWIGRRGTPHTQVHVAITAGDRSTVDAFHAAALEAGGRDNGAPGPRPHYHEHYYGAFVLDPDGNNIEAVCHRG